MAASPNGATFAAVLSNTKDREHKELFVWDAETKKQRKLIGDNPSEIEGLAFSSDGRTLATVGPQEWDGLLRFWNTRTWRCRTRKLDLHLRHVAFAPTGDAVAVASGDYGDSQKIAIVEAGTGRIIRRFANVNGISQIAFSPDGRSLAVAHTPDVSVWSVGGRLRWREGAHSGAVALTFSTDSTTLASCDEKTIVVWDATRGTMRYCVKGHANTLQTLAFSPDDTILATASWDEIKLRDAANGEERLTLKTDWLGWIGFWPTPDQLSAGGSDFRFTTWNVAELLKAAPATKPTATAPTREQRIAESEQGAFLQAIFDSPEDDTARLAYADWLDEHGQAARAEFIRVQIGLTRLTESAEKQTKPRKNQITKLVARERELLDRHSREWLSGFGAALPVIDNTTFERGFVKRISMTGIAVTDEHLSPLARVPEVLELDLSNSRITAVGLRQLKPLCNLRELILTGTAITPAALNHLAALPKLVEVYHHGWGYEQLPPEAEAFKLKRNQRLVGLSRQERREEALRSLRYVGEVVIEGDRLLSAWFSQRPTTDADLAYLSEFSELEQLGFCETLAITSDGLAHLRGLKSLKQLHLVDVHITTLEPLRYLTGLEELRVWTAPRIEQDSLRFLAELPRLKNLSLFNCQFDDTILPHVAKVIGLEELNLTENEITDEGLELLAPLPRLKKLEVDYEEDRRALVRRLIR
ncbi:MAG: TIGR02996 domain-containing protein [Planctomycetes bacterium]|nr:TIGR02996 domain-containing protein [Planctomycetota bacterium]